MADTQRSSVLFSVREQILSGDLNRLQKLASREAQDVLLRGALRDSFTSSLGIPVNPGYTGTPGEALLPSIPRGTVGGINVTTGSFALTVLAGQVDFEVDTSDVDASDLQVARWGNTNLTINPDSSQYRVDLIIATPAEVPSNFQSRNILLDPNARTIAPQNVYKTQDPLATISVVTGVPGVLQAPACPTGSVALWEVVTNNTDADATAYRFIRRVWRRVESLGTVHGILEGCVPVQNGVADEGTSLIPYLPSVSDPANGSPVHRAIIDGELIVWPAQTGLEIYAAPDQNADPTAVAAGTFDTPFYWYLAGGRWAPQNGFPVVGTLTFAPLRLIASLTPPAYGRASAALQVGGQAVPAAGTLYIGIGFISGASLGCYKGCRIVDDWVYPLTSQYAYAGLGPSTAAIGPFPQFTEAAVAPPSSTGTVAIHTPAPSTACDLSLTTSAASGGSQSVIFWGGSGGDGNQELLEVQSASGAAAWVQQRLALPNPGYTGFAYAASAGGTQSMVLAAIGYNMNARRIGR